MTDRYARCMETVVIDGDNLTLEMVKAVSLGSVEVSLSSDSRERMQASRKAVEDSTLAAVPRFYLLCTFRPS